MTPERGEFNITHVLMFLNESNASSVTVSCKKDHDKDMERIDRLLPTRRNRKSPYLPHEEKKVRIASMLNELKKLARSLLRPAKKVELCSEWGPLLPKETEEITFPKPLDEIIELVKENIK